MVSINEVIYSYADFGVADECCLGFGLATIYGMHQFTNYGSS